MITQPKTGAVATIAISALAVGLCTLFTPEQFSSWVTLILVAMVPGQIIQTLFLGSALPGALNQVPQPFKGLMLTGIMVVAGAISFVFLQSLNEGVLNTPTPFSIMLSIFTVVVTLWLVIVFQGWPFKLLKNPFISALTLWATTLLLSWLLFQLLFDFSQFKGAPFYSPTLDPSGLLPAWQALALVTTSVAVILVLVLLDFWPLCFLKANPLSSALAIAVISLLVWSVALFGLNADPVRYMVAGPISMIFGEFILLVMLQTAPFQQVKQPKKGGLLSLSALGLCLLLYPLYASIVAYLYPALPSGAPMYGVELWIASAMLAVTFPMFVMYAEMFQFWPFDTGTAQENPETSQGVSTEENVNER